MNIEWNAEKYTEDFSFVHQYGNDVADLIDLKTGSTVLDLGCGNGALTEQLKNKGFHVIGIDASEELLNIARRNYPDTDFIKADATSFSLDESVDAVFPMRYSIGLMAINNLRCFTAYITYSEIMGNLFSNLAGRGIMHSFTKGWKRRF